MEVENCLQCANYDWEMMEHDERFQWCKAGHGEVTDAPMWDEEALSAIADDCPDAIERER